MTADYPVLDGNGMVIIDIDDSGVRPGPSVDISFSVIAATTVLTTGDGKLYVRVPTKLNGMNLVSAAAAVHDPSASGAPTIQIARGRQSTPTTARSYSDILSTRITLDVNEYDSKDSTTAPVIDTATDDMLTGDLLRIDVDVAGTGTKGLEISLGFQSP